MAATASISFSLSCSPVAHGFGSNQLRSTIGGVPVKVSPAKHVLPSLVRKCDRRTGVATPVVFNQGSTTNETATIAPSTGIETRSKGDLKRKDFPPGFLFGVGSSAYQVEGGYKDGNKGLSVWDAWTHDHKDQIFDGKNGDVACDQYHRYKEDVKLIKDAGLDVYRFSLSWPRILPQGTIEGGINQEGIDYYNNLINELKDNGITPFVTLFHWDVPLALEQAYGGFLNPKIIDDFKEFARVCFKEFGDRVQNWATINEPYTFTYYGYDQGVVTPGRCSKSDMGAPCKVGDSATEPYQVTHNLILAHATAYRLYQDEFKATQKGQVGLTLNTDWMFPYTTSNQDSEAAERILDFYYGWYLEPIVHGDYPFIMKALVKERLPAFTPEELSLIKGSYDYIGVNYYSSKYAQAVPFSATDPAESYSKDAYATVTDHRDGKPIGQPLGTELFMSPSGIKQLLLHTAKKYNNPPIYLMENGISDPKGLTMEEGLNDQTRIKFYASHLRELRDAIRAGANVKGFFAWSLLDSFEWINGYTIRMGLTYVDFNDGLKRYPKASLEWFKEICESKK